MSEENSLGGILSVEDAEATLMKRMLPEGEAEQVEPETDETEEEEAVEAESEEVESDESAEAVDEDATLEADEADEAEEAEEDTDDDIDADELKKGYLRQADYTRKRQAQAEKEKAFEVMKSQFEAQAQQKLDQLEQAVAAFSTPTEQEPNWAELAKELDSKAYDLKRQEWNQKQAKAETARQLRDRIADQRHQETRAREAELLFDRIPEWRDAEIMKAETAEIVEVAGQFGLSEAEVTGIMDHRQVAILRTLAMQNRAAKAVTKKQAKPRKKVSAAAAPVKVDSKEKAQREMSARLKKTGSVDDAIAFLMERGA